MMKHAVLQALVSMCLVAGMDQMFPGMAAFVQRSLQADSVFGSVITAHRKMTEEMEMEVHRAFRRRHFSLVNPDHVGDSKDRRNEEDSSREENCDQALLLCLPEEKCSSCFRYLYGENVDWGTVTPETSCHDVLGFLAKQNYCPDMHADAGAKQAFCNAFNACAVWEDEEIGADDDFPDFVDCSSLTECNWDGIHEKFLGDGICNEDYDGCYNTAICGYDGGDCCEDTCKGTNYVECGHDGFVCRDPNSTKCDPIFSLDCKNAEIPDENNPDPADTKCDASEVKYRLFMFDSFGDGWDKAGMTISPASRKSDIKFNGGLTTGSKGIRYICLPKDATCMHVDISDGQWGNEVSWEIRPMNDGAPAIAGGGAPMSCDFSVSGKVCSQETCTGKANVQPNDEQYKAFKEMYGCIEEKCTIQVGVCEKDETCNLCLTEEKDDFCYGNDSFLAVVDCTMCRCTDRKDSEFCHTKLNPAVQPSRGNQNIDIGRMPDGSPRSCSPGETMKGTNAVLNFAQCSNMDQVSMLVSDYDENQFGLLDQFEKCAHSYQASDDHGGHTALGCMSILESASHKPDEGSEKFAEAIAALANQLYHNAGEFCECASKASADCPLCSSFVHVKTLLYESLDACQSLDEIDCAAWAEFYTPCKRNVEQSFGSVDFTNENACQYVLDGCGHAGTFPAFRRLDCGEEITGPAWDFYNLYAGACLKDQPTPPSNDAPTSKAPVAPLTSRPTSANTISPLAPKPPPTPRPTTKPYFPSDSSFSNENTKPYTPPDDSDPSSSTGEKSHFVRNILIVGALGAVGYVYYKRRTEAFSFVRYRNTRNYAGGESEMYSAPYSGLTMDSSSGAFQPPSLPPTPSAIDNGLYY